jgi:hypothetical protein
MTDEIPDDTPEEIREIIRGLLEQQVADALMGEDGQAVVAKIEKIDALIADLFGLSSPAAS